MARPRPNRGLAIRALELVRADPNRGSALVPGGEDGITPDAVLILVAVVNKLRDSYDAKNYEYDLRELVQTVCVRTPLDRAREYAYEIVLMRYYTQLSVFAAARRRRLKLIRKNHGKRLKRRAPLVLISAA